MENDNQILLPQSFIALFVKKGHDTPSAPYAEILERYELCEDLAQMLITSTAGRIREQGISEKDVLEDCLVGLSGAGAVLTKLEAQWVVLRLAELIS